LRYLVPGWPSKLYGHSAVTPNLVRKAASGAQQYKQGVVGQPGTQGIPVEPVVPSSDVGDLALAGVSRSSDAPNTIYPNLYYDQHPAEYPGAGMPISRISDNLMPVPAVDPRGIPSTQFMPRNDRGQRAINTLPNLASWA
jgi:hypothetical protein